MTSYVVKKQQCPKCKSLGKDNSHDNLVSYSDGHSFCFSCGFGVYPDKTRIFKETNLRQETPTKKDMQEQSLLLPEDSTTIYPEIARNWVKQYEITENDLLLHNTVWSNSIQRLIFPVYYDDSSLIAWQGRYFGTNEEIKKKQKWFGRGNLKDTFNFLGSGNKLILTEDIVSAIKVSKCGVMAMPLYGCSIGRERFKRLYTRFGREVEVSVWLDADKRKEAIQEAKLGRLCGLNTTTIFTDLDPKEIKYEEIKKYLN